MNIKDQSCLILFFSVEKSKYSTEFRSQHSCAHFVLCKAWKQIILLPLIFFSTVCPFFSNPFVFYIGKYIIFRRKKLYSLASWRPFWNTHIGIERETSSQPAELFSCLASINIIFLYNILAVVRERQQNGKKSWPNAAHTLTHSESARTKQ